MLRKILLLSAIGVSVLFLLKVFATPTTESTWIVRLRAPHGLQAGDTVEENGRRIGRVISVNEYAGSSTAPTTDVVIAIDAPFRERVREHSTILVNGLPSADRPVLHLIVSMKTARRCFLVV